MSDRNEKALVLRTIYLNQERDEELRKIAFDHRMSKGEIIRRLIEFSLQHKNEFEKVLGTPEADSEGIPKPKNDPDSSKDTYNTLIPEPTRKQFST